MKSCLEFSREKISHRPCPGSVLLDEDTVGGGSNAGGR
ncbi:hypothetical protein GLA29479_3218 [Lysobacter antibioticus]|nr:hypothetical protein GLA29479_3218 [Lysobacter antibioticus]